MSSHGGSSGASSHARTRDSPRQPIILCDSAANEAKIRQVVKAFLGSQHDIHEREGRYVVDTTLNIGLEDRMKLQHLCNLMYGSILLAKEPDQLKSTSEQLTSRPDTIRIKGIPTTLSREQLAIYLTQRFGATPTVHSLAPDDMIIVGGVEERRYCATATFPAMTNHRLKSLVSNAKGDIRGEYLLDYDDTFMDITPLYEGDDTVVDIIAVEGLGTHAFGTFRALQGEVMWLRDFLPKDHRNSRILLYGYDSKVKDSRSNQILKEIAKDFMERLLDYRQVTSTQRRPIIWIGQSMGGLIIQELLCLAQDRQDELENLAAVSVGLVGFGIPINGLRYDSLLAAVRNQPNHELIKSICLDGDKCSQYLVDLAARFADCVSHTCLKLFYFLETNVSADHFDPKRPLERRVGDSKEIENAYCYYIPKDHSGMVKFSNRSDGAYIACTRILTILVAQIFDSSFRLSRFSTQTDKKSEAAPQLPSLHDSLLGDSLLEGILPWDSMLGVSTPAGETTARHSRRLARDSSDM